MPNTTSNTTSNSNIEKMSPFATDIMNQKYAHDLSDGGKESWPEIAHRVAKNVMKAVEAPKELTKEIETAILNKEFMPGGRYLYATGRAYHQTQNCFAGETVIVTRSGAKPIGSLVNTIQKVMTSNGVWTEAPIMSFGRQKLSKVVLIRAGITKEIYATPEHSWRISKTSRKGIRSLFKQEVLTKELKKDMKLCGVYGYGVSRTPLSIAGIQHGIVYGDGNVPFTENGFNTANIRLCGEKDSQLLQYFYGYPTRPVENDVEVSGLPRHYKLAPLLEFDRSYLFGWLAGYFAADGHVTKTGSIKLSSCDKKSLELVKNVCYLLGIGTYGIRHRDRISNLTEEPSTIYEICFMSHTLTPDFFLIKDHKDRFVKNPPQRSECMWRVVSVEETQREEEVFCAVVPDTHEFVLEDNILTGNCLLLRAEDSREGWSDLLQKASMALMTGAGIGVNYSALRANGKPIRKTGGIASGPVSLMQMVNECARFIVQGGNRRAAVWAGLTWKHADVHDFIHKKDWSDLIKTAKANDYNFPAPLDGTNISVCLDDEFFEAYNDTKHALHSTAYSIYWDCIRQMLSTGEPGFAVDVGKNAGEDLRNAPVCGETMILTNEGYKQALDIVGKPTVVWTGKQWAKDVVFKKTFSNAPTVKVFMTGCREISCEPTHPFLVEKYKGKGKRRKLVSIERTPAQQLRTGDILHVSLPKNKEKQSRDVDAYTLGYVYGDGSFSYGGKRAEITFCTNESKKSASFIKNSSRISSINHLDKRGYTRIYFHTDQYWTGRSKQVFPTEVYSMSNLAIASFVAGLFDSDGNYEPTQKRFRLASKHKEFLRGVSRALEQIGILAGVSLAGTSTLGKSQGYQLVVMKEYNQQFSEIVPTIRVKADALSQKPSYRKSVVKVIKVEDGSKEDVFCADVGVEEHSFMAEGVIVSNCTEVTSRNDSDICNLGSINMSRVKDLDHMKRLVEIGTAFLVAGSVYSDVPYAAVDQCRTRNRRIGLGLMGLHEWLLTHGKKYGPDSELEEYLKVYATNLKYAKLYAKQWDLTTPIAGRAIAPTGTIGIVAETSTGIEPIFCVAYKRRYLKGNLVNYQYVVDPVAQRLINCGIPAEQIEDAYSLAENVERRVEFQQWVQKYVDHGVSSTINLPQWGSEFNNEGLVIKFGNMLMKHLPNLRGITCYPDGARGKQPLSPVSYKTAIKHVGEVFVEQADVCSLSDRGSCGG